MVLNVMAHEMDYVTVDGALGTPDLANEQRGLLDLIDTLQHAQLDNVKLPQIIAVGDQSAGKSSVLEALTGTPFPRDADACTRFPTEIRLRRAKEESCSVFILPDKKTRSFQDQERLRQFHATLDASNTFADLMRRAVDEIAPKNIPGRFASADILVVEKRGPNLPLLTVVDLPGLVRIPNKDQSAEDLKAIEDITDRYMKSSRAIILAVIGGNGDYTQAAVLQKARKVDPRGERTIGVLTKPDLTPSIGLEDKFIGLVSNKDRYYHFDLGWFVLLNPGPRTTGATWPSADERRATEESFFATGKWSALPQDMCGATALKQKLSTQLLRHIGRHLQTLRKEIQQAHDACSAELKSLGVGKDTVEEMREELIELCSLSKELVTPAVEGTYTNPFGTSFFPKGVNHAGTPTQKLRARAVEENRRFAQRLRYRGRRIRFVSDGDPDMSDEGDAEMTTKQAFAQEVVEPLLQQNTGTEFPREHNPRLAYTLFQSYAANWPGMAQKHKDALGVICNEFLSEVIDSIWPRRMQEPLRRELLDPQMKALMDDAQKEVERLAHDLNSEIQPYGTEYDDRLTAWRAEATAAARPFTEAEELLEKMLIYYDILEKMFVQNVITQVIERHLLQGLKGIYGWRQIHRMPNETVLAIAAESKETRDARMDLKAKLLAIEESRDILAKLAMRKDLRSFGREGLEDDDSSDDEDSHLSGRSARPHSGTAQRPRRGGRSPALQTPSHSSYEEVSTARASYTPTVSTNASSNTNAARNSPIPPALPERTSQSGMPGQYDYDPFASNNANYHPPHMNYPSSPTSNRSKEQPTRAPPAAPQGLPSPPQSAGRPTQNSYPSLNSEYARTALNTMESSNAVNGAYGVDSSNGRANDAARRGKKMWGLRP